MPTYADFLFAHNFTGNADGTDPVPGITLNQSGGRYVVKYSILDDQSDVEDVVYYDTTSNEETYFATSSYNTLINTKLSSILSASNPNDARMLFTDVANITFTNTDANSNGTFDLGEDVGDITYGQLTDDYSLFTGGTTAFAAAPYDSSLPFPTEMYGDIWFNADHGVWTSQVGNGYISPGDESYKILLEETTHSLGVDLYRAENRVDDQAAYDPVSNPLLTDLEFLNSQKYTVTSYKLAPGMNHVLTDNDVSAYTLQLYDIAALQAIYGANTDKAAGNTSWTPTAMHYDSTSPDLSTAFLYTIWDGGGSADVLDVSELDSVTGIDSGVEIDLRPGRFSSIGNDVNGNPIANDSAASATDPDPGNVAIAYGTKIENVIGTEFDDIFHGLEGENNHVDGGSGGSDTIDYTGTSNAVIIDLENNEASDDGGGGVDTFDSIENARGSEWDDSITGSIANNILWGEAGNDTFFASAGDDTYHGGWAGRDTINLTAVSQTVHVGVVSFASDDDTIEGTFDGIEQILLGEGDDNIGPASNTYSNIMVDAGDGTDTVTAGDHDVLVSGDSFLIGHTGGVNWNGTTQVIQAEILSALGGNVQIRQLGHQYETSDLINTVYDYSRFETALTFTSLTYPDTLEATDGVDVDTFSTNVDAQFVGTNNGDTLYLDFVSNMVWLGTGDDYVTLDASHVVYTGGADVFESLSGGFSPATGIITLAPFIDASDVSFDEVNLNWSPVGGGRHSYYDLEVTIAGRGSILIEDAGQIYQYHGGDGIYGTGDDTFFGGGPLSLDMRLWDGREFIISNFSYALSGSATIDTDVATPYADSLTVTALEPDLHGGSGDDTLTGDEEANELHGGFGIDTLHGLDGNDTLYGGFDGDTLYGGDGFNILSGEDGDDQLHAEAGSNVLEGGSGSDTYHIADDTDNSIDGELITNRGINNIVFTDVASSDVLPLFFGPNQQGLEMFGLWSDLYVYVDGIDTFSSITFTDGTISIGDLKNANYVLYQPTTGNDAIDASSSAGSITMALLAGNDTFVGTWGNDVVYGGDGNDEIDGLGGDEMNSPLNSWGTADYLDGGDGEDTIIGGGTTSTLVGGQGNDTILSGLSGDSMIDGGDGVDTLSYENGSIGVGVTVSLMAGTATYSFKTDTVLGIENIVGTSIGDTLTGDNGANAINGGDGNDTINGGGGNDVLDGEGNTDTVTYAGAGAAVTVSLAIATAQNTIGAGSDTLSNFENLTGSSYNDVLAGNSGANVLTGGDGNDTLDGGTGNDTLNGGNGTDTASYASAASAVTVFLSSTSAQNTIGAGTDTITNTENLTGSAYNDTLSGNSAANTIEGGDGNDTILGSGGNDTLTGGNGSDTASYNEYVAGVTVDLAIATAQNTVTAGTDTLSGFENLYGSKGADTLYGDANANTINGGDGNDILYGRGGADILTGGASGADTFVFETATAFSNVDTITDFGATDKIDLHDILDLAFDPLTNLIADFVNFTNSGSDSIMSVDRDGTGTTYSFVDVASLTGVTSLDETTLYNNGNLLAA